MTDAQHSPALKSIGISILITLAVWLVFSWPLPKHVFSAIPSGAAKPPQSQAVQPMSPGDNLQLDYHFWLLTDMLAGRTPWFYNLYEFNTGNDKERYEPGSYYVPFSLFYAAGSWIAGRAFGWNFSGFISLWLTVLLTYRLARRYTGHEPAAWIAAALSIALPYRWLTLMGGSPTGFSMMWVPLLMLGIDLAVREDRVRGGVLAGVALLFSAWGDAHTFFFAALMVPCWCVFAFLQRGPFAWKSAATYLRLALALAPVVVFALIALVSSKTTARQIGEAKGHARTIREVALFSPHPDGLFAWNDLGISNHVFLGYALAAAILVGLLATAVRSAHDRRARLVSSALLVLGMAGIVLLALGPFGPFSGRFFTAARKCIPHYDMIRQPAKVFCLMPSMLAVLFVLLAGNLRAPVLCVAALLVAAEFRMQNQVIVCRVDTDQGAYRAVADSAKTAGSAPRALVIPLWPGDSHYTSIYQHDASLYRIRLVNGYRPFVSQDYIDTIFHGFESANLGFLADAQLDDLLSRGVEFVILHEDLFPEKVSPFPVGATLQQLRRNPRLEFLQQDGPVWAFRIAAKADPGKSSIAEAAFYFPARRFELEKENIRNTRFAGDKDASRGGYVKLDHPSAAVSTTSTRAVPEPGLRWLVRLRGQGSVRASTRSGNREEARDVNVQSLEWSWYDMALPAPEAYDAVTLTLEYAGGGVDADTAMLIAGTWRPLNTAEAVRIPAASFFHAGQTQAGTGAVVFKPGRDRLGTVLYGPKLPLEPGDYEVEVNTASGAGTDVASGTMVVTYADLVDEITHFPVQANGTSRCAFSLTRTLPFMVALSYNGNEELEVRDVVIRRTR